VLGSTAVDIHALSFDSRKITAGSLFVAVVGVHVDGHLYMDEVVEAGTQAIVCQQLPSSPKAGITYIVVENSAQALGIIASNFYNNPSSRIKLLGITGTNGKTTVATLLFQ